MMLQNHSIKLKIIFISALSSSIALVAFSFILFYYETTFVKRELISNLQTQVEIIAENSLASLAFMDDSTTYKTLGALKHNSDILFAGLYDINQQLLANYQDQTYQEKIVLQDDKLLNAPRFYETKEYVQLIHPIYLNNNLLGYLVLRANFASFNEKLRNYGMILLIALGTSLLMALFSAIYLQRIVSRPLVQIAKFIHNVTISKSYDVQMVKESDDEFGRLVDAFNEMMAQLNRSFIKRNEAEKALSHHLNSLQETVNEQTFDLKYALKAADAANHSKSEFLANMSHEIRTPMNAIMGMTHLAQCTNLTEKQRDYLNKIDTATHSLLTIINDILDFSKMEAGKMTLENTAFSLDKVLAYLLDILKVKAEEKNIELAVEISPKTSRYFEGDPLRLGQILLNLASNAVKFTEHGKVTITIESKNINEKTVELLFSVRDTGIGMTGKQLHALFQPFSQADSSITRKYGGTGLGLSISKQLVELMGGELHVNSIYGHGSTFSFNVILPLASGDLAQCQEQKIPVYQNENYNAQRILLVEDNDINQQVAMELLTSMGLSVKIANDGQEAVNMVLTEAFDLIFMDIQMPIMDGLTATRLIRAEKTLQNIPIIAMTAHAMQGDKEKSLAAGMNDHLTKPIDMDNLIAILNNWLKIDKKIVRPAPKAHSKMLHSLPDELPPFDLALAAQFTGDDPQLLHHLLLSFAVRYANSSTQLDQWIQEKEFAPIGQLAHSIKGVAGTLVATELRQAANELEFAIRYKQFDHLDALTSHLKNALATALEAITLLPPLPEETNNFGILDTLEFLKLLAKFNAALQSNHFNAVALFEQIKPNLNHYGFECEVRELIVCLDELNFKTALLILEKIDFNLLKEG